jgi:Ala-tRNA(Pro) deacylase|tara:strand:- start:250 stop:492 length:243 start_codon:yes stop_codon:yes gene_type:complete
MSDTHPIDATAKDQDNLPMSSDQLMAQLDQWHIQYQRFDHVALKTVEDAKKVQALFLSSKQGGGHIKNLYLRDHKNKKFY